MQVLIVEDERRLADALCQIVREQKYLADVVYNGRDGLDYALSGIYDVIVLDVMLPQLNGFEVVKKLREAKITTPVLMLTARDEISSKVTGLDSGADDYMTKPFSPEELLARIRSLSRRQGEVIINELKLDDLTLNLSDCSLSRNGKSMHLGFKEFEVMKILMSSPKAVVSKDELIAKVWGLDSEAEDNNVEAYISFLRKKISHLGSAVNISTLRKMGYLLKSGDAND